MFNDTVLRGPEGHYDRSQSLGNWEEPGYSTFIQNVMNVAVASPGIDTVVQVAEE